MSCPIEAIMEKYFPEEKSEKEDEETDKYKLLNKLFKFINNENATELNEVLSGYFCNILTELFNKK